MFKHIFFMLMILSAISCKDSRSTDILNQKINFDEVENVRGKCYNDTECDDSICYSVVVYWDSITCPSCILDEVYIWKEHKEELKSLRMDVLLIFDDEDMKRIPYDLSSLCDRIKVGVDKGNAFYANNIFLQNRIYHTSVVNQSNEIIWLGSPLRNENTWRNFKEYINYLP